VIAFGPDICGDYDRGVGREWLETNGLGGYASSTVIGANTRRYHGLLIAALKPPTRRTLLLSKVEETLAVGNTEYDLSCNQYPGAIHPRGHQHLAEFRLDPFPTFVYEVGDGSPLRLEKTVAMCRGHNTVIVRYRLLEGVGTIGLVARPICNCRDHHHLMRESPGFDTRAEISGGRDVATLRPYPGVPPLHLQLRGAYFESWGYWYRNFEYAEEQRRGLDFREDQYSPGFFTCEFDRGQSRYFIASLEDPEGIDPAAMLRGEVERRASLASGWEAAPEEARELVAGASAFAVSRAGSEDSGPSGILAGYHWFEEWGRDAMIALPGLALVTGRYELARRLLRAYAQQCSRGMIPNRIPDADEEPDYNTVDATLWMFWAAYKYLEHTKDQTFIVDELLKTFQEIVDWHVQGTRYGVVVADDGLLRAGEKDTQLTWMDAKVGDWVVTPREGKPVEVNALWHHALRFLEDLDASHAGPRAEAVAAQIRARFWNDELGHLNDVVDGESAEDASLRPNQIFAVSLPYPVLDSDQARQVVAAVERDLLTPYGLRTLSPHDPRYRGRYRGDQLSRDGAYHQGTVWPWLMGHFVTAYLKVNDNSEAARRQARAWFAPLFSHLQEAGLGHISEVFDGDSPHRPGGCIAQAWSAAEILRAAVEELGWAGSNG